MPEVTAIEPQKKKPDRFNIFVDGEFRFGLDAETLVKSGLKIGQEISRKKIEKLVFENEIKKLMEKALRFLSFRPRSEREVRDHLRKKFPISIDSRNCRLRTFKFQISVSQIVDNVLDRLKHLGYVDDLEFARWWIEQRQTHSPRGARLIRSELFQKGVAQEIIDKVLPEDEEGEVEQALKTAQKKLRSYQKLDPREFKQKMGQYLARKGFDWEVVRETLNRLVDTPS